jgi:hypothetical protein
VGQRNSGLTVDPEANGCHRNKNWLRSGPRRQSRISSMIHSLRRIRLPRAYFPRHEFGSTFGGHSQRVLHRQVHRIGRRSRSGWPATLVRMSTQLRFHRIVPLVRSERVRLLQIELSCCDRHPWSGTSELRTSPVLKDGGNYGVSGGSVSFAAS